MFHYLTNWIRRIFNASSASYHVCDGMIVQQCEGAARELVRLDRIERWCSYSKPRDAIAIRLRDGNTKIVRDNRNALRELLLAVAQDRKLTDEQFLTADADDPFARDQF